MSRPLPPRRRALLGALAGVPVLASLPRHGQSRPSGPIATPPLVASLRLGPKVTVHMLSDGVVVGEPGWFTGLDAQELASRLRARPGANGSAPRLNLTTWLIDDGERLILIDTGVPAGALPTAGRLPSALRSLGVAPEQVDILAATHAHFDHVGGHVANGRAAFPNAQTMIGRADIAHFTDPARAAAAPAFLRSSFELASAVVAAYPRLEQLDLVERAITPSVSTIDLSGHTPGHTGYRVTDGDRSLAIVGDALFDPALHPGRDDIGIVFEADPQAARAMRARLFPRLAEERALVAATHMPFPGLGRIDREGGRYIWVPADFPHPV